MSIHLTNKPIAITGASSGIGAATALACARAGMPVALGARRIAMLEKLVKTINDGGGRAIAVPTDVTSPEQCRTLVERTIESFGSIYAVYANAGYGEEKCIAETTDEDLRAMFETNFFGTMSLIRAAMPHLLANPAPDRGHVLICSSCLAKMPVPYCGVYSATKAAQSHIGRAMRVELEPRGVHVSVVHPIGTRTEFFDKLHERARGGGGTARIVDHTPGMLMQSAEFVADRTVACLRRPRAEVWTGFMGAAVRTGMSIGNMFPRLTDRALRGMVRRRMFPHQTAAALDATPQTAR